jgi:hypothetical protein
MNEYVDPIQGVPAKQPVDGHSESGSVPQRARHVVIGKVTAIHRRNVHHESGHILDATVGGDNHTELVIRVESGLFDELDGKRVAVTLTSES